MGLEGPIGSFPLINLGLACFYVGESKRFSLIYPTTQCPAAHNIIYISGSIDNGYGLS